MSPSTDEAPSETAILTIDLGALAANYRRLCELAAPAECGAVVKADAYGLGMAEAALALARAGCNTFFVATLAEARDLRALLPRAIIYVFSGLMPGTAEIYRAHELRPVLNSADEIREWAEFCAGRGEKLPCAVHIDSGMNRLGLSAAEVDQVAQMRELWQAFTLALVMSHLACSDEPAHPKNEKQRKLFDKARIVIRFHAKSMVEMRDRQAAAVGQLRHAAEQRHAVRPSRNRQYHPHAAPRFGRPGGGQLTDKIERLLHTRRQPSGCRALKESVIGRVGPSLLPLALSISAC